METKYHYNHVAQLRRITLINHHVQSLFLAIDQKRIPKIIQNVWVDPKKALQSSPPMVEREDTFGQSTAISGSFMCRYMPYDIILQWSFYPSREDTL